MGKFVVKGLAAGEHPVMTTRLTGWLLVGKWLVVALALIIEIAALIVMYVLNWPAILQIILDLVLAVAMVVALVWALVATIIQTHVELVVTNRRVVNKSGVFDVHTKDIPLKMVINVNIYQPLLGRILDYGTITISTAAQTYTLEHIKSADFFKDAIIAEMEACEVDHYALQAQAMSRVLNNSRYRR